MFLIIDPEERCFCFVENFSELTQKHWEKVKANENKNTSNSSIRQFVLYPSDFLSLLDLHFSLHHL